MTSLYKYLPEKYIDSFVRTGAVLFRSLSYYRDFEDAQVRGDEFEGTRIHRPKAGLEITVIGKQEKIVLPHSFESTANEDDIFVFCVSTVLSEELARQFKALACIEITDLGAFVGGIRSALVRRPSIKNKKLVHGHVRYYSPEEPPIVDWALPDRIVMSKLITYASQQEYRFAFAVNDAFSVQNTSLRLASNGERRMYRKTVHAERLFKLGKLSSICKVHRFDNCSV